MDERPEMRTPIEHIEQMTVVQERLMKFARENLKRHDAAHLAAASTKSLPTIYVEGSYVLFQYPGRPSSRTKPPMEGPFKVIKDEGNSHYLLQDLVDKKERRVHISRMKEYRLVMRSGRLNAIGIVALPRHLLIASWTHTRLIPS